jgi:hypothetical protein
VRSNEYYCAFCAVSSEPTLDDVVEVSFTVSPRVRKIAAARSRSAFDLLRPPLRRLGQCLDYGWQLRVIEVAAA